MNSYAIVNIKGIQYKLFEKQSIYLPHLFHEIGKKILLDKIYLFVDQGIVQIGNPYLKSIHVKIEILEHLKGKKMIIFKKKRRKGYKVKKGFRPLYSKIQVVSFLKKIK
ncbi:50S ribosomal protein L21 [Blattabacterium cuenoti]|nr:50S ribosomal protein L21 [Blattabacterium cuenoti]